MKFWEKEMQPWKLSLRKASVVMIFNLTVSVRAKGFPGGPRGKEPTRQCRSHKKCRFDPWAGKIPWKREWHLTSVFFPGEAQGQRNLAGYGPYGHKESDTTKVTSHM